VIDEFSLDLAPVLLGSGERLFDEIESFDFEPVLIRRYRSAISSSIGEATGSSTVQIVAGGTVEVLGTQAGSKGLRSRVGWRSCAIATAAAR